MKTIFLSFLTLLFFKSQATNLIEVSCISNKIIQLKFVDGFINFHNLNEERGNDRVTLFPGGRLSNVDAKILNSYAISSSNDPNYSTAINPIDIGLNKRIEQSWDLDLSGRPTHVEEIYVYLFLENALIQNGIYSISVSAPAVNSTKNNITFTFSDRQLRSESIHVNNLGYSPKAENKFAYVYAWLGDHEYLKFENDSCILQKANNEGRNFYLINTNTQEIVLSDTIRFREPFDNPEFGQWGTLNNNFLGAEVYECEFSNFNTPGEYVISVEGIGCSFPFKIDGNYFHEPLFYTLKNLYENRSGIELSTPYAQYNRPICHKPGTNNFKLYYSKKEHYDLGPSSSDSNIEDTSVINAEITGEVSSFGWYQDAGDWDAYWTHSKVPANLLSAYEMAPTLFDTMNLNIQNESTNQLPDILDEARWLLRFYKRSKDDINNATLQGSGGVPGARIFGDIFATSDGSDPEDGHGSWQDVNRKWVMLGEGPHLTFIYAGIAAQFAQILQDNGLTDPESINWLVEAENAWDWAVANTDPLDIVPSEGYDLTKLRIFAAAALYRSTGNKVKYEDQFIYDIDHLPNGNSNLSYIGQSWYEAWDPLNPIWESIPTTFLSNDDYLSLACLNYYKASLIHANHDIVTKDRIYSTLKDGSDFLLGSNAFPSTLENRACRWGGNWWLPMGIGQSTSPIVNLGAYTANLLLPTSDSLLAKDWFKNMFTTNDYFMGTNPLNMTMISGIGEKSIHQFFHMDSWYCNDGNNTNIKKGFVSYGPMNDQGSDLGGYGGYPAAYQYYYGLNKSYPLPAQRPGHERFMPSRTAPLGNENTIHQTCINTIVNLSALYSISATPPTNLSLNENQSDESFQVRVFPNPSNSKIQIQSSETIVSVVIYSIEGREVFNKSILPNEAIDIKSFKPGVYVIKCKNDVFKEFESRFIVN